MRELKREQDYSWDRPVFKPPGVSVTSYPAVKHVLERGQDYNVPWSDATGWLFGKGGQDFMLSGDSSFHTKQKQTMEKALFKENWNQSIKNFYEETTLKLLHQSSFKLAGMNMVDITKE